VPVILATFAVIEGVPRSTEMLNIVFFAVLVSAAVQGPTVHPLAARLPARAQGGRLEARADDREIYELHSVPANPRAPIGRAGAGLQLISCRKDDGDA
jgi:NhaP-type Na+/H+ or K+/H+ antiporter